MQLYLWFCRAPEQHRHLSPRIQLQAWKQTLFVCQSQLLWIGARVLLLLKERIVLSVLLVVQKAAGLCVLQAGFKHIVQIKLVCLT